MAAETVIDGRKLHLKDIAVFPKEAKKFDIGMKEVLLTSSGNCLGCVAPGRAVLAKRKPQRGDPMSAQGNAP